MNAPTSPSHLAPEIHQRDVPTALVDALKARFCERCSTALVVREQHGRDESAFAPVPPPNTAFRVWEFVADPPLVELSRIGSGQLQLLLYGAPPKSLEVQAAASLDMPPGGWGTWATTGPMTNSFRLFLPFAPPPNTNCFYRAREL